MRIRKLNIEAEHDQQLIPGFMSSIAGGPHSCPPAAVVEAATLAGEQRQRGRGPSRSSRRY